MLISLKLIIDTHSLDKADVAFIEKVDKLQPP